MSDVVLEIVLVLVLIIANGVFSMSETALISARKTRLQQRAEMGDERAEAALEVANAPNNFLATVQIGITLIGIVTGVISGATISEQIAVALEGVPALAPYGEAIGVIVVVAVITFASLVIGELVPKQIALNNPEQVAALVARPMRRLSVLAAPLVKLLDLATILTLRLLGVRASDEPAVTEDEINVMMKHGAETGTFEEGERQIVEQVFWLNDLKAGSIMTPRTEIVWLNSADTPAAIREHMGAHSHTRYPVAEGTLDNVIGVVGVKDLVNRELRQGAFDLRAILQKAIFLPEDTSVLKILKSFREEQTHIAFIIDEFGGVQGLVTMSDVVEIMTGEGLSGVMNEDSIVRRTDGSYLLDGLLNIEQVYRLLGIDQKEESKPTYHTLGGFILAHLQNIPITGDFFTAYDYRFEVVDMDGRRIDKVLVIPPPAPALEAATKNQNGSNAD